MPTNLDKYDRITAAVLGTGIALFPLHWIDQPLKQFIILPQLGNALIIAAVCLCLLNHQEKFNRALLGSRFVWIPMLVIVGSLIARIAVAPDKQSMAGAVFGLMLFAVYLCSRILPTRSILLPIAITSIVVALSAVVASFLRADPGSPTAGIITNYQAGTGVIILGGLLWRGKRQWILVVGVVATVLIIGTAEGLFALLGLGVVTLIRRDWGRRSLVVVGVAILAISSLWVSGRLLGTYANVSRNLGAVSGLVFGGSAYESTSPNTAINHATSDRWYAIVERMKIIQPFGHGFYVTYDDTRTSTIPHNVPLVIVDQIGPLAGAAWLFVSVWMAVKARQWRYLWAAVLILSVWDHYLWTQLAPLWWCLAGVSTVPVLPGESNTDLIFRKEATP